MGEKLLDKKGQMGTLQGVILTLVVVGIVLGLGFMVLGEFQENIGSTNSRTVANESDAYLNMTGYTLSKADACNFGSPVITEILNMSDGYKILVGNATVTSAGVVTNATTTNFSTNSYAVNLSYTYTDGGSSCEGVASTVEATEKIPGWLGIIVILAIVGILLAIVFNVLPKEADETLAEY